MTREASAKYYKKTKKRFKRLLKDIKILLKRKKTQKREYAPEPYKNLSENEKQKVVGIIVLLLKGIKKCGKVTERLFNRVSVSSYKNKGEWSDSRAT